MLEKLCSAWSGRRKVLIGMCHVPALPGSPRFAGDIAGVRERVLRDADALAEGGVDGIFIENFGDVPFFPDRVPAATVAQMAVLADRLRTRVDLPLGINVLRNDGRSALAIAQAVGAAFVRVNVLSHARLTDQGVIQSIAHDLLRERAALGATGVRICADVSVKESVPLASGLSIEDETDDLIHRGLADAVIVSGANTGSGADVEELRRVRGMAGEVPVFVGSGVSIANVQRFLPLADGFIVGTSLKVDGRTHNPVDAAQVRNLVARIR
jgi:membrane complex biogenesis BtpA family protein